MKLLSEFIRPLHCMYCVNGSVVDAEHQNNNFLVNFVHIWQVSAELSC